MAPTKAAAGTVGALVAIGMLLGAAICAAPIRRAGSRRLLIGGAGLFSLGMLVCAIAPAFALFGAARLAVGVGLGIVLPTVTAYVADLSAPERRGRNIGIMMSGYAAGALLAPLLGAALLTGGVAGAGSTSSAPPRRSCCSRSRSGCSPRAR